MHDPVNQPKHYTSHPSGIDCIQITEHMGFNLGNAVKYIWRADLKNDAIEDLRKARWYIDREISKRIGIIPPEECGRWTQLSLYQSFVLASSVIFSPAINRLQKHNAKKLKNNS